MEADSDTYQHWANHQSFGFAQSTEPKAEDQFEFDETASVLTARRVINLAEWEQTISQWQTSVEETVKGHPWENETSQTIIDDLRGGPVEPMEEKE
jgi:hypothetical protein